MNSAAAYEKHANAFLEARDRSLIGVNVVKRWAASLPEQAEVLEIACGGGYPVTTCLVEADLNLRVLDSSETMLATFRKRFPDIPARCERFQDSDGFNRQFEAVIAIGFVFLLSKDGQQWVLEKMADLLVPGGRLLFTAPLEIGTWKDVTTGTESLSLGYDVYQGILDTVGLEIINTYEDSGKNNYYETRKRS